jgi:hypothetical protein
MSYLRYLCLLAHSGVEQILRFVTQQVSVCLKAENKITGNKHSFSNVIFFIQMRVTIYTPEMILVIHMSVTISACKRCSYRLYRQLFVGGLMSYLRYLCLLAHSGVQQILRFVLLLFLRHFRMKNEQRWVSLMREDTLTVQDHLSSPPFLW